MTDQNAPAADFTLSPEQFESEMNQPLFEGPMMMAYDEAQAVYGQCLHYASLHCNVCVRSYPW